MSILREAYDVLFAAYGPQHWWPGESNLEIAVGAILTQNTSWQNVERALANLRDGDLLDVNNLQRVSLSELAETIRPAGYYRQKSKRLKNFVELLHSRFDGSMESLLALDCDPLREVLLSVNGIGPETADSIALYAGRLPVFVVDAYTARVAKRHGWIGFEADYYQLQELFHAQLESDHQLFNEYHALIVRVGKDFCQKTPRCEPCPLKCLLPEGGPQMPDNQMPDNQPDAR